MSTRVVAACAKWVDLAPEIDALTGMPTHSGHSWGFSEADRAAFEVALRLAEAEGAEPVLVCAGPPEARDALGLLAASGPARSLLIEHPRDSDAGGSARVLADWLGERHLGASTVVCGDISRGRGSGSVPAYIAHHLGFAQALGLLEVSPTGDGLRAVRRLDGARREVLAIDGPVVLSVEGSIASLRRAPLPATITGPASVEVVAAGGAATPDASPTVVPFRPAPRSVPAPRELSAFERIVELTGALEEHIPPRRVEADPCEAATQIIEQLRAWGYAVDEPS